jgi:tryptophan 2,3-dioxygenase
MAEPTNEQRKAIGAFVKGTLSPLIEEVLTKKLAQAASFVAEELRAEAAMAATVTDEQIQAVWQSMPGGPDGFRKQWGFMQFARAVLDLVAHEDGVLGTLNEQPKEPR